MGGTPRYEPGFTMAVFVQIVCIVLMILLPVIWVLAIFLGLLKILWSPSKAISTAKNTAGWASGLTKLPFAITLKHWRLLYGRNKLSNDNADEEIQESNHIGSIERQDLQLPKATKSRPGPTERRGAALLPYPLDDIEAQNGFPKQSRPLPASLVDSERPYQYQHLNGVDEFRLLIISPGLFDDALHGQVISATFSGSSRPAYEALSYTWADETGDAERSSEFLCDADHSIIRITKNCEAAIRRLRRVDRKRRVWIDAICIDQSSETERTYQVSMMSKIYTAAQRVVVYLGEGTPHTDTLFDWLNGLKTADLDVLVKWDMENLAADTLISFERYLTIGKERLLALFSNSEENKIDISQQVFVELAKEFFSRRWFKRVWVLQEVSLPDVRDIAVICGTRTTTAIRALHALSLIYKESSGAMIRIFVLLRKKVKVEKSHLLDVLIETRDREAGDPRDKIFGVLSIANVLNKGIFPELKADYGMTTAEVYVYYSAYFIAHHGPGFFLSLIKSPPALTSLPSWAADWTVPWPNYKAVEGRDFAATSRPPNDRDGEVVFREENGHCVLVLRRPRILQGYFTRNGHMDGEKYIDIEGLDCLQQDEILVEIYPGLAALLRLENGYYVFTQVCPHALYEGGVEELVGRWSKVVVDGEGPKNFGTSEYLGLVECFNIR